MEGIDGILIASDLHPYQHCRCGHLRRSHHPRCFMCGDDTPAYICEAFVLCPDHPGVEAWRLAD